MDDVPEARLVILPPDRTHTARAADSAGARRCGLTWSPSSPNSGRRRRLGLRGAGVVVHLLRSSPDDLGALVAATADALGLDTALVEKDYWVTEVLRSVARPLDLPAPPGGAEAKVSVVFKGGTSLSKVYRLIERFSEDVDVLVVTHPAVGKARADATLRRLCDRVGDDLAIADTVDGAYPKTGLKRDRRLVEKLALLHDAATRYLDDTANPVPLLRAARHFYDVRALVADPGVLIAVEALPGGVAAVAADVEDRSRRARRPCAARPASGYGTSPAFDPHGPCYPVARQGYDDAILRGLVWGIRPSFDDCLATVAPHGHLL